MKNFLKVNTIVTVMIFLFGTAAFGASADYRFTGNDHDTLLIGEIIGTLDDDYFIIRAEDFIVSARTLDINNVREQLRPEIAIVRNAGWISDFNVGDYVIASLNQSRDGMFVVANGIFKVDSLDYRTLTVEAAGSDFSAMFTDFVNSGGRYADHIFMEGTVIRRYGGFETIIYEADSQQEVGIVPITAVVEPEPPAGRVGNNSWIYTAFPIGVGILTAITATIVLSMKYKKRKSK